jgi:adenylate/nucleoside-diphosphate kinase
MLRIPIEEVFKRTASKVDADFGSNRIILKKRLSVATQNLHQAAFMYQKYYNNVVSIDGMKSKWFVQDKALNAIEANFKARINFARDYVYREATKDKMVERPCLMQDIYSDRQVFKNSLSQFGYFCPVSHKLEKKFISCTHIPEFTVLYKELFYYFADAEMRRIFVQNPKRFTENVIFSKQRNIPIRYAEHKAAEISETEKMLLGYCPVTLMDAEKLVKGVPLLVISHKEEKYIFSSEENLQKFFNHPSKYSKAKLPVKIPPEVKEVSLFNLQREENSVTFLEQALGSVVTKGLREIGETRLKYPTLSVKETMLKLFAIFLKTENPANTEYMKEKYRKKMEEFLEKCTVPEELNDLAKKKEKGKWPQFKENYYNQLGQQYDSIMKNVDKEKAENFSGYMK